MNEHKYISSFLIFFHERLLFSLHSFILVKVGN